MTVIALVLALAVGVASGIVGAKLAFWSRRPKVNDAPPAGNAVARRVVEGAVTVRVDKDGLVSLKVNGGTMSLVTCTLTPTEACLLVEMLCAATNSSFGAANDTRRIGLAFGRQITGGVMFDSAQHVRFKLLDPALVDTDTKPAPDPVDAAPSDKTTLN